MQRIPTSCDSLTFSPGQQVQVYMCSSCLEHFVCDECRNVHLREREEGRGGSEGEGGEKGRKEGREGRRGGREGEGGKEGKEERRGGRRGGEGGEEGREERRGGRREEGNKHADLRNSELVSSCLVTFLALWRKAAAVCLMITRISSTNDSSGTRFLQNKCWNERWELDSVTWGARLLHIHSMWSAYMYVLCWTHKPHTHAGHTCSLGTRLQRTCAMNTQISAAQSQETVRDKRSGEKH